MSDQVLIEEPLQFGDGGRLFGILTSSNIARSDAQKLPVFIFLNAGLLHRVGPYRLYVRLARELAQLGFNSLRIDLAGRGDSPARPGLTNHQSIAADFADILGFLESRMGRFPLVLAGLCSGADNAIRLTIQESRVIGMVLLDPICSLDFGFRLRAAVARYTDPARHVAWFKRQFKALTTHSPLKPKEDNTFATSIDPLTIRYCPPQEQLRSAFELIRERKGRVLSIFTQYALGYYNKKGQLRRVLRVNGYSQFCSELFWPHADHTYRLELDRRRLIEEIKAWAGHYLRSN